MNTMETNGIGQRLRTLREAQKLTQEELAAILRVDKSAVSRIERGERGLAAEELALVATRFGVSADFLLFGEQSDEVLLRADGDATGAVAFAQSIVEDIEFVEALLA